LPLEEVRIRREQRVNLKIASKYISIPLKFRKELGVSFFKIYWDKKEEEIGLLPVKKKMEGTYKLWGENITCISFLKNYAIYPQVAEAQWDSKLGMITAKLKVAR
jgi:hypothetical protein